MRPHKDLVLSTRILISHPRCCVGAPTQAAKARQGLALPCLAKARRGTARQGGIMPLRKDSSQLLGKPMCLCAADLLTSATSSLCNGCKETPPSSVSSTLCKTE